MIRLNCKATSQANPFTDKHSGAEREKEQMWTGFKSSNIDGMTYKVEKKQLWVRFKDGSVYTYFDVPLNIAKGLYKAGSKGRYFWKKIRNNPRYKYQRLTASLRWRLNTYQGLCNLGGERNEKVQD